MTRSNTRDAHNTEMESIIVQHWLKYLKNEIFFKIKNELQKTDFSHEYTCEEQCKVRFLKSNLINIYIHDNSVKSFSVDDNIEIELGISMEMDVTFGLIINDIIKGHVKK